MDSFNIIKKVKRLNRKGKLINTLTQGQGVVDEKKEIVTALMVKCDKSQQEVLEAYDDFHIKYEDGSISRKEYTNSQKVNIILLIVFVYYFLLFDFRISSKQRHYFVLLMKTTAIP
jgi:hypothetical protein